MIKTWALALAVLVGLGMPAAAQPQQPPQRDPFGGQFGAVEIAMAPREAARQATMLADALSALAPQRPGRLDVYVVTAAFWGDPVFESEASQASDILKEHFNVESRSILLTAGGGMGERRYPAATPNNLYAALGRVGSLIDPEEDLVVVFLTSHGSPNGSMALRESGRLDGALKPTHLRDALMAAGVRNRVVIVSSCFSGAFIAPLMDDRTAVFTAAAPDRSSFGCQPQRDWTFFGDAYFNRSVRDGTALIPAFDRAKTLIEQWEREQNLTPPSNPQRFVGPRAAEMLQRAEREARRR